MEKIIEGVKHNINNNNPQNTKKIQNVLKQ